MFSKVQYFCLKNTFDFIPSFFISNLLLLVTLNLIFFLRLMFCFVPKACVKTKGEL